MSFLFYLEQLLKEVTAILHTDPWGLGVGTYTQTVEKKSEWPLMQVSADIVKIEHPERGDDTRAWGPPYAPYRDGRSGPGESAYYLSVRSLASHPLDWTDALLQVNRNKKSLALSFKEKKGADIIRKLAATSDIMVENYLPGSLKKYGLDYESMAQVNKNLIYASITGYGQTGPYSDRAGYDVMVEACVPPIRNIPIRVPSLSTTPYADEWTAKWA